MKISELRKVLNDIHSDYDDSVIGLFDETGFKELNYLRPLSRYDRNIKSNEIAFSMIFLAAVNP
jgi:hypothetical protein